LFDNLIHSVSSKIRLLNWSLAAIMMVLLMGGAFFGPMPVASADEEDDDDERDGNEHVDKEKKCKKKQYGDKCDKGKPKVDITSPDKKKVTASMLMVTVDATDSISGIKKVELRINGGPRILLTDHPDSDTWKYSAPCDEGKTKKYNITAKATDWVGNSKRDHVEFKLTCTA